MMDCVDIRIELDPVNDGAEILFDEDQAGDEGLLVIGTNGDHRIIGSDEAEGIFEEMPKTALVGRLGRSRFMVVINDEKIRNIGGVDYFIGSVVIFKSSKESKAEMLSGDDFDNAYEEFISRLSWVTVNGQEFTAYEV